MQPLKRRGACVRGWSSAGARIPLLANRISRALGALTFAPCARRLTLSPIHHPIAGAGIAGDSLNDVSLPAAPRTSETAVSIQPTFSYTTTIRVPGSTRVYEGQTPRNIHPIEAELPR